MVGNRYTHPTPSLALVRRQQTQAIADELEQLRRRKAALSLELMSLQDSARNRKQGVRGSGAITLDTEARFDIGAPE